MQFDVIVNYRVCTRHGVIVNNNNSNSKDYMFLSDSNGNRRYVIVIADVLKFDLAENKIHRSQAIIIAHDKPFIHFHGNNFC